MPGAMQLTFIGRPLDCSTRSARFYEKFGGPKITASVGDIVEVSRHDGKFIGILMAMWERGVKKKEQQAEILWFNWVGTEKKHTQELLITAEASVEQIASIQKVVSVKSRLNWELEEKHTKRKSKRAAALRFYCEYGFLEQAQTKTSAIDWTTFYTQADQQSPEGFQTKVEDFIMAAANAKLSSKLSGKLKTKPSNKVGKIQYLPKEDSDFESTTESESSDASSLDISDDDESVSANEESSRATKRRRMEPEEDNGLDEDWQDHGNSRSKSSPGTPRKKKARTASTTPRTPKRFTTVSTPGSKGYRVHAPLEVTPLPARLTPSASHTGMSPHQLARQKLHVAEVPTSLPCREEEFSSIFEQVESAILENESALIYVSGTPGTGKTATVREVIAALQQKVADEELFPFKFVEINGMKIPDPTQAYSRLWETLTGQRVTPHHALSLLQTQFTTRNPSRMPCVVLMDELDQLTTMKQEVMYNFFQWPNMPNTRLIVVAVANTMDLPERTLAHKVSSRLGLTRIAFAAYTRPQLNQIIKSRLSSVRSIDVSEDAIDYACLRVSRVSGDARRALDICRRAFELAEPGFSPNLTTPQKPKSKLKNGKGGEITVAIMKKAFDEMTSSPLQIYLKMLPFASKIFLKAVMACVRRTGLSESSLGDVMEDTARICKVNTNADLEMISGLLQLSGAVKTAHSLAEGGIMYMEDVKKSERYARIRLKIPESELLSSWAEDGELSRLT